MTKATARSTDADAEQNSVETVNCWRIYPAANDLFEDELGPSDNSILIRQDEETDEYLRGYVAHPEFGNGLEKATFRKANLVGWREETVVPHWPSSPPLRTRVLRGLKALLPSSMSSDTDGNRGDGGADE